MTHRLYVWMAERWIKHDDTFSSMSELFNVAQSQIAMGRTVLISPNGELP